MTGAAAEVTPVREVDARRIGRAEPGPVTRRNQETGFRAVHGEEPRCREWLFPFWFRALANSTGTNDATRPLNGRAANSLTFQGRFS